MTQSMLSDQLNADLQQTQAALMKVQAQMASGKRINAPSDDPVGTQNVMTWQAALDQNTQYQANANDAVQWLQSTDSALQSAVTLGQRARSLAVSTSTGTLSAQNLSEIGSQVAALKDNLIAVGNTKIGDHYLFSGQDTTVAPFDTTTGALSANLVNATGVVTREVGDGIHMPINTPPTPIEQVVTAVNQIISDLGSPTTAAAVSGADLGTLDTALDALSAASGQNGSYLQQVQTAQGQLTDLNMALQKVQGGVLGADLTANVVQLQQLQVSYQSALAVGARMVQPTLAQFLQ